MANALHAELLFEKRQEGGFFDESHFDQHFAQTSVVRLLATECAPQLLLGDKAGGNQLLAQWWR